MDHCHCGPRQALDEIENDVSGLLFRIIDLRTYAKGKEYHDSTPADKRKNTPLLDRISSITVELAKERIAKKLKEADGQRR